MRNLKLAVRSLFHSPFVTVVAILSLALGIGANAAIFSVFNEMLLRPLPVPHPEQLVDLEAPGPNPGNHNGGIEGDSGSVRVGGVLFHPRDRALPGPSAWTLR